MGKKRICLDPGHYGSRYNSGAVPGYYESAIVWKLTMLEKEYLEKMGIEVVLTRTVQSVDLELVKRGQKAAGCDLFVSNHTNACDTPSVDRVVAIYLTDRKDTSIDEKSKAFATKLASVVSDTMGIKTYNAYSRLAGIDRDGTGKNDDNYYGVLHGAFLAKVPGVIIEHSFHTNADVCRWLMNDDNLDALAKACAKCMAEYLDVDTTEEPVVDNTKSETIYRVQTGSFRNKEYAESLYRKLKAAGFGPFLVKVGALYKVQVGAYKKKANAIDMANRLKAAGFDYYITTKGGEAAPVSSKKSIDELAKEVLAGKWGNGSDRKNRLTKAGYDYAAVQKRVNELL